MIQAGQDSNIEITAVQFEHVCERLERIGERLEISQNVRRLPRRPLPQGNLDPAIDTKWYMPGVEY